MDPSFQDSVMRLLREMFPGRSEEVYLLGAPASTTRVFHCWIWWALLLSDFLLLVYKLLGGEEHIVVQ